MNSLQFHLLAAKVHSENGFFSQYLSNRHHVVQKFYQMGLRESTLKLSKGSAGVHESAKGKLLNGF